MNLNAFLFLYFFFKIFFFFLCTSQWLGYSNLTDFYTGLSNFFMHIVDIYPFHKLFASFHPFPDGLLYINIIKETAYDSHKAVWHLCIGVLCGTVSKWSFLSIYAWTPSDFSQLRGFCSWKTHAIHWPDARLAPSASLDMFLLPECNLPWQVTPPQEFWAQSKLAPGRCTSSHHLQMGRNWSGRFCTRFDLRRTGLGRRALGSDTLLLSRACHGCCTWRSSPSGSDNPANAQYTNYYVRQIFV